MFEGEIDQFFQKYYGTPRNGTPCFYELSVDFIFTFKLRNDDKDSHVNEIFLFSVPYKVSNLDLLAKLINTFFNLSNYSENLKNSKCLFLR